MAFAQESDDLLGSFRHGFARDSRAKNVVQPECSSDSLLHGRKGHHHKIVLILAGRGKAFGLEDANYLARHALDADRLPDGIVPAEQIVHHSLTEDTNRRSRIHISIGEESSQPHIPSSNLQECGGDTAKPRGPVFPLIDDLKTPVCIRRHTLDQGDLLRHRRRITKNQRAITPGAKADPVSGPASSFYPNKIVSQALKLLLYAAADCIPNRHNADERAYSHRDSQNRKNTSDPVAAQRRGGFSDCVLEVHSRYVKSDESDQHTPGGSIT